jgi:hypothetical protein
MKVNKAISAIASKIGSAFKRKKKTDVKPTNQEKVEAKKESEVKHFKPTIFGKPTEIPGSVRFQTKNVQNKHVNKGKFKKKAKLKRRKAA